MGCLALRRASHTAPELEQGPEQERMGYVPIFQVQKLFRWCVLIIFQWLLGVHPGPRHREREWFPHDIGPVACPGQAA